MPASKRSENGEDLTGKRFRMLTVIRRVGIAKDNHVLWECLCDCGNIKNSPSNTLKYGRAKSCGCLRKIASQKRLKEHGAWNDGKSYAIDNGDRCYKTRHAWSKAVLRHYGNKCEICGWDKARCDTHHRTHKASGGMHTIENGLVLCPNCHRIAHLGTKENII